MPWEERRLGGIVGTWASIVAGLLIVYVLWVVYDGGVAAAFRPPALYAMAGLVAAGFAALAGYVRYAVEAAWHMRNLSPLALALGAGAVVAGVKAGPMAGGALVVAAYMVEIMVGARLYRDFLRETRLGATLFLVGVLVFMGALPLILVDRVFALVSLAGDAVKVAGLLVIAARMHGLLGAGAALQEPREEPVRVEVKGRA